MPTSHQYLRYMPSSPISSSTLHSEGSAMASFSDMDYEMVVLELTDPSPLEENFNNEEISISTSEIESWNLPLIRCSRIVKVSAKRSRLVEGSSYFRGLIGGSFSESSLHHVSIQWNREAVLILLQFMHGQPLDVTIDNFLLLLEGALFFGVEDLLLECETWFYKSTSSKGIHTRNIPLDILHEIWKFGFEHGLDLIPELCKAYLAQNFAWATSCSSFADIPYDLLYSCAEHPQLTVESEKQLCEALLVWLANNSKSSETIRSKSGYFDILNKVRTHLLPLGFAAGQRKHFLPFADEMVSAVLDLIHNCSPILMHAIANVDTDNFRIRLTKYSEKIVLSGCVQLTATILILAVLPHDLDGSLKGRIIHALMMHDKDGEDHYRILERVLCVSSFESVHEVDVSKCPKINFDAAIIWLHQAFPSLRILKACYCRQFKIEDLHYLLGKCPLINELDLTVDISPLISTKMSMLSVITEGYQLSDGNAFKKMKELPSPSNSKRHTLGSMVLSNISKLTLEGRNDISDMNLLFISALSHSLSYLNIKGCTLVTDMGISKLICKCRNIHSLILSYTTFGSNSILALCSSDTDLDSHQGIPHNHKHSDMMAFRLQQLHINACRGVDHKYMSQLMSHTYMLQILSVRDTCLIDNALFEFMGSHLESLDVSETMVSMQSLTHIIKRNPLMRNLKATSCQNFQKSECNDLAYSGGSSSEDLFYELGKNCTLEEVAFGWGFSSLQLEKLKPAMGELRAITLGLGASLGHQTLSLLPEICPLLESVVLNFQVISDNVVRSILESLKHLQVLWLRCCLGDLTALSFHINMPRLRTLRLDWSTPLMSNNDLLILTQNFPNLVELSLSGCKLLDPNSQEIISSGWPGLTSIHLEDCGKVTSDGVNFLLTCIALEDLLLRHNGCGIGRNFISDAASKLPLLRKVALDLCDACEGGFDSPSHADGFYLSNVRLSCCMSQKCGFEFQETKAFKPIHKKTIVLEWNSRELRTTEVKERI